MDMEKLKIDSKRFHDGYNRGAAKIKPSANIHCADPSGSRVRVVDAARLIELAEDMEAWAEARWAEDKKARLEKRKLPHHDANYYCANGQADAADRIRDLIRNESFLENGGTES